MKITTRENSIVHTDQEDPQDWLEKIRRKPRSTKELYAFAVSAGITVAILALWYFTISFQSAGQSSAAVQSAQTSQVEGDGTADQDGIVPVTVTSAGSPLDNIQSEFSQMTSNFQNSISSASANFQADLANDFSNKTVGNSSN